MTEAEKLAETVDRIVRARLPRLAPRTDFEWANTTDDLTGRIVGALTDQPLRQFAEWIVSLDDDDPESPGREARRTVTLAQIVDRARVALGGPE